MPNAQYGCLYTYECCLLSVYLQSVASERNITLVHNICQNALRTSNSLKVPQVLLAMGLPIGVAWQDLAAGLVPSHQPEAGQQRAAPAPAPGTRMRKGQRLGLDLGL